MSRGAKPKSLPIGWPLGKTGGLAFGGAMMCRPPVMGGCFLYPTLTYISRDRGGFTSAPLYFCKGAPMFDLEPYQYLIGLGRAYQLGLFFYGMYLLTRRRLWLLQIVFLGGAASYATFVALAGLGIAPAATPYRLLSTYGNATCFHVLLLVIHTLIRSQSLGRLKPFSSDYAP